MQGADQRCTSGWNPYSDGGSGKCRGNFLVSGTPGCYLVLRLMGIFFSLGMSPPRARGCPTEVLRRRHIALGGLKFLPGWRRRSALKKTV